MFFSVIVPIYNVEKYLDECITSILKTKFKDMEVILVDDSSTDSSLRIAESYKTDPRVKVYSKPNEGCYKTWKYGFEYATGLYTVFVDSDDIIVPEMFDYAYKLLKENPVDLLQFDYKYFGEAGSQRPCSIKHGLYYESDIKKIRSNFTARYMSPDYPSSRFGKVFRTELLRAVIKDSIENIVHNEDDSIVLPYVYKIKSLNYVEYISYYQRIVSNSISHNPKSVDKAYMGIKTLEKYFDNIKEKYGFSESMIKNSFLKWYTNALFRSLNADCIPVAQKIRNDTTYKTLIPMLKDIDFVRYMIVFHIYTFIRKVKK